MIDGIKKIKKQRPIVNLNDQKNNFFGGFDTIRFPRKEPLPRTMRKEFLLVNPNRSYAHFN